MCLVLGSAIIAIVTMGLVLGSAIITTVTVGLVLGLPTFPRNILRYKPYGMLWYAQGKRSQWEIALGDRIDF